MSGTVRDNPLLFTVLICMSAAHCLTRLPYRLDTLNTEKAELHKRVQEAKTKTRKAVE
jgi:hypothetical protein